MKVIFKFVGIQFKQSKEIRFIYAPVIENLLICLFRNLSPSFKIQRTFLQTNTNIKIDFIKCYRSWYIAPNCISFRVGLVRGRISTEPLWSTWLCIDNYIVESHKGPNIIVCVTDHRIAPSIDRRHVYCSLPNKNNNKIE